MDEVKGTWGGARKGAGRPKGATNKEPKEVRPQHQLRAFADEWEMIKAFAKLTKQVPKEECLLALKALEAGAFKKV